MYDISLVQRGERMSEEEMEVMVDDACPCKDGKLDYAEVLMGRLNLVLTMIGALLHL